MKQPQKYNRVPSEKREPYTRHKWKQLGILKASSVERLIVLELFGMKNTMDWFLRRSKDEWWDEKDMRAFAKDLAKKIHALPNHKKGV